MKNPFNVEGRDPRELHANARIEGVDEFLESLAGLEGRSLRDRCGGQRMKLPDRPERGIGVQEHLLLFVPLHIWKQAIEESLVLIQPLPG